MASTVMAHYKLGDKIGITGPPGGFSLLFYTQARGVTWVGFSNADERPADFFSQPARVLCVIRPDDVNELRRIGIRLWVLDREPKLWLVTNQPPERT
jgi:hypothetical protein